MDGKGAVQEPMSWYSSKLSKGNSSKEVSKPRARAQVSSSPHCPDVREPQSKASGYLCWQSCHKQGGQTNIQAERLRSRNNQGYLFPKYVAQNSSKRRWTTDNFHKWSLLCSNTLHNIWSYWCFLGLTEIIFHLWNFNVPISMWWNACWSL